LKKTLAAIIALLFVLVLVVLFLHFNEIHILNWNKEKIEWNRESTWEKKELWNEKKDFCEKVEGWAHKKGCYISPNGNEILCSRWFC